MLVLPGGRGDRRRRSRKARAPTRRSCGTPSPSVSVDDPLLAFDGPITFDATGQNENATVIVMQVQNGKVEQVFPERVRRAAKLEFPAYPASDAADAMAHVRRRGAADAADAGPGPSLADARLPPSCVAVVLAIVLRLHRRAARTRGLVTQAIVTGLLLGGVYAPGRRSV